LETIIVDKQKNGVIVVTLNRPEKLNAINPKMAEELLQTIDEVRHDDQIKIMVITGAGRGFCSGTDLSASDIVSGADAYGEFGDTRQDLRGPTPAWAIPLATIEKPVIAAINGVAAGAGLSMALACDIRLASEDARFAPIWIKRGLIPEAGSTYFLSRIVGKARAYELVFTGDIIDARDAERINLVNRVVKAEALVDEAIKLAAKIAANPPITLELAKKTIAMNAESDLTSAIYLENRMQCICHMTEDHKEGVAAFREKRPPVFKGK